MGCQAGVEPANLTTVMNTDKTTTTKSYATIKLGIDAHAGDGSSASEPAFDVRRERGSGQTN